MPDPSVSLSGGRVSAHDLVDALVAKADHLGYGPAGHARFGRVADGLVAGGFREFVPDCRTLQSAGLDVHISSLENLTSGVKVV